MNFDSVFANPTGRLSRNHFVGGLVVLLLVVALLVILMAFMWILASGAFDETDGQGDEP